MRIASSSLVKQQQQHHQQQTHLLFMSSWKKKFGSLVPGGAARDALQNVLTVEWSGHKTVLVEVPQPDPTRSNDVELDGFSAARPSTANDGAGYDRLEDEVFDPYARHASGARRGQGERAGRTQERFVRPYLDRTPSPSSARERELPALPSENLSTHNTAPPPRPVSNPFANPFSHEDDLLADIGSSRSGYGAPMLQPSQSRPVVSHTKSESGSRRAPPAPRPRRLGSGSAGAAWDEGGGGMGGSVQSPTESNASSGSNGSATRPAVLMEEDDPFR